MNENSTFTPPEPPVTRKRGDMPFWGFALILLGGILLLQQFGFVRHFNWWAVFILIPAFGSLGGAWTAWRRSGSFNAAARSGLGGGLVVLTVALMFLFDVSWRIFWPLMIIMPGLSLLLSSLPSEHVMTEHHNIFRIANMGIWIGLSMIGLGGCFLADNLNWIDLHTLFNGFQWWGVFILIPGLAALVNSFLLARSEGSFTWAARSLLAFGAAVTCVGALVVLHLSWNLLTPVIFIAIGLALLLTSFKRES